MPDVLGYARVSTGDQDVAGQTMRLTRSTVYREMAIQGTRRPVP